MPCGHGGVSGKHRVDRDRLERAGEIQALLHQVAQALQDQERRVPFVDMPDRGLEAERGERAHPADAEHDLLLDAGGAVAAVELMRDVAILRVVFLEVGVEQVQGHAAGPHLPYFRRDPAPRQLDG